MRLAIEHGATIVPFAMLGGDDAWDIVWDAEDLASSPFGQLISSTYDALKVPRKSMMPLARGMGPTMLPKPVRLYFSIGEPIDTRSWAGKERDDQACYALREQVAAAIYTELDQLAIERKWDPREAPSVKQRLLDRLLRSRWGR